MVTGHVLGVSTQYQLALQKIEAESQIRATSPSDHPHHHEPIGRGGHGEYRPLSQAWGSPQCGLQVRSCPPTSWCWYPSPAHPNRALLRTHPGSPHTTSSSLEMLPHFLRNKVISCDSALPPSSSATTLASSKSLWPSLPIHVTSDLNSQTSSRKCCRI